MLDITFPSLIEGTDAQWSRSGKTLISAVSPSGNRLAYALEKATDINPTTVVADEYSADILQHPYQPVRARALNKRQDSTVTEEKSPPTLPVVQYRVVIVSSSTSSSPARIAKHPTTVQEASEYPSPSASSSSSSSRTGVPSKVNMCQCTTLKAPVTALQWLDDSHIACGLEDGTVAIITRSSKGNWMVALSRCFHRVQEESRSRKVLHVRLSGEGVDCAGDDVAAVAGGARRSELTLWVLYGDRVVVCVGVEAIIKLASATGETPTPADSNNQASPQPSPTPSSSPAGPSFAKLQLEGQAEVLDVIACSALPGLFEVRTDRHSHVILAAGLSPALAFYPIGPGTRSFGLANIAWAVASRVTSLTVGAIDGIFGLVGLRGRGRKAAGAKAKAKERRKNGNGNEDGDGSEEFPAPLVLRWDGGLQDGWRRVTCLCLDPSGRLAAAADGFGRVMLVDCATRQILRMWKGVRGADCGWIEVVESWKESDVAPVGKKGASTTSTASTPTGDKDTTPVIGLYLAILAPLRGRVELWRMRHGSCVKVVPAPAGARLLTSRPNGASSADGFNASGIAGRDRASGDTASLTSCFLLSGAKGKGEAETRLRLSPLLLEDADFVKLPSSLSREAKMEDDTHRLRNFATAIAEMRVEGFSGKVRRGRLAGEMRRLSGGQEAREETLYELLSQLQSVDSLAQATTLLEGGELPPGALKNCLKCEEGAVDLSASVQRRICELCRERAGQAESILEAAVVPPSTRLSGGSLSMPVSKDESVAITSGMVPAKNNAAAVSSLRLRAAAHELYSLLELVEVQVAEKGEKEEPAFLPPGKRGWKHALLCEEAAGWASMAREAGESRRTPLPSADLPDFQEFLETVSAVLEASEKKVLTGTSRDRLKWPPLLRFKEATVEGERRGSEIPRSSTASPRRSSVDSLSSVDPSAVIFAGDLSASDHRAEKKNSTHRERLFGWIFRPLLSDAFAMVSLTQALSFMGLEGKGQVAVLVRDMAAWFLALPVDLAVDITVNREAQNCTVLRWLKGVILTVSSSSPKGSITRLDAWDRVSGVSGGGKAFKDDGITEVQRAQDRVEGQKKFNLFDEPVEGVRVGVGLPVASKRRSSSNSRSNGDGGDYSTVSESQKEEEQEQGVREDEIDIDVQGVDLQADAEEALRPMFEACAASERLENAAMLSVVAAEALASCRERLEESSLGEVAIGGGGAWMALSRRLRLCLFVDRRLHWGVRKERRDRASVRRFQEGMASVYALIAKDQLISYGDLTFAACSARESSEVEASARSQREAGEAKATSVSVSSVFGDENGFRRAVSAAPSLVDPRMDGHWRTVQAVASRPGNSSRMCSFPGLFPPHKIASEFSGELRASIRQHSKTAPGSSGVVAEPKPPLFTHDDDDAPESSPTTIFFMRSHAQPTILACHRTRWLVLSWASTGSASTEALGHTTNNPSSVTESVVESVGAEEAAVRRLSLAVDHLSYLRTSKPFLAGCVAYWLWEHGGIRSHVGELARGQYGRVVNEGRPAREAFLAAAEEFLRVEALFTERQEGGERGKKGVGRVGAGGGGGADRLAGRSSDVSFMSLLTEGTMKQCPWPGAWDRWVEECLRDAQVHAPLQPAVAAHSRLLRALRVKTICNLPEGEVLGLFENGSKLCVESALRNETFGAPSIPREVVSDQDNDGAPTTSTTSTSTLLVARREGYIMRALEAIVPRPAQNVYRLARDFGFSEDKVRGWHSLVLLRRGHDVLGEEVLSQIFSLQDLAGDILTVMRLRLKHFLDFLEISPSASGGVLASLDADTCQWIRSVREPLEPGGVESTGGGGGKRGEGKPLRSTHAVLLCLARALPRDSRYKRQANALVTLVGTVLRHLGGDEVLFRR